MDLENGVGEDGGDEVETSIGSWYRAAMGDRSKGQDRNVESSIRLPAKIHGRLRRAAFDDEVSQNSIIVMALESWLDGRDKIKHLGAPAHVGRDGR